MVHPRSSLRRSISFSSAGPFRRVVRPESSKGVLMGSAPAHTPFGDSGRATRPIVQHLVVTRTQDRIQGPPRIAPADALGEDFAARRPNLEGTVMERREPPHRSRRPFANLVKLVGSQALP